MRDPSAAIVFDGEVAAHVADVDGAGAVVAHDHAALDPGDPHAAGAVLLDDHGAGAVGSRCRRSRRSRVTCSGDVLDQQLAGAVVDLQRGHVADLRGAAAVLDVQGHGGGTSSVRSRPGRAAPNHSSGMAAST